MTVDDMKIDFENTNEKGSPILAIGGIWELMGK